jgi:hypothetical protein
MFKVVLFCKDFSHFLMPPSSGGYCCWLKTTCHSQLWVWILTGTLPYIMWGRNQSWPDECNGSFEVLTYVLNRSSSIKKAESWRMTFTVLKWLIIQQGKKNINLLNSCMIVFLNFFYITGCWWVLFQDGKSENGAENFTTGR